VAAQYDHGAIKPAQKFTRDLGQRENRPRPRLWTVYESCGFGYTLHHGLVAAGAHSLVITPLRLQTERRRKNDRLDARELCVRLSRYLDGNQRELAPIRVPTRAEQERREIGRQREFYKQELYRLENHGRALRIEHEHQSLDAGWAGPRNWKKIAPTLSECVRTQLEPLVEQIRHCQEHLDRLTAQIEARVAEEKLPKGLGALTMALVSFHFWLLTPISQLFWLKRLRSTKSMSAAFTTRSRKRASCP
jgi:transposase